MNSGISMLEISKAYSKSGYTDGDKATRSRAFLFAIRDCTLDGANASIMHHLENVVGFPDPTHIADWAKQYDARMRYSLRILEALEREGQQNKIEELPPTEEQKAQFSKALQELQEKWLSQK